MIPVAFDYVAPTTVEEALSALAEHGDEAKIMAGGQSLLPVLRMRLNAPEIVIDLGKIESLRGIRPSQLLVPARHPPVRDGGRHRDRRPEDAQVRLRRRCLLYTSDAADE